MKMTKTAERADADPVVGAAADAAGEDPFLVGFAGGMVFSVRERLFRPQRASDRVTLSCGFAFEPLAPGVRVLGEDGEVHEVWADNVAFGADDLDPAAGGEDDGARSDRHARWLKGRAELLSMLAKIQPDRDALRFLLEVLALGCLGVDSEHLVLFCGPGSNGKTVMSRLAKAVLGDYCAWWAPSVPPQLVRGKRLIEILDVDESTGAALRAARDDARVNLKCTVVACVNARVPPSMADAGMRLFCLPFPSTFTSDRARLNEAEHVYLSDPRVSDRLRDHRVVLMNLLLGLAYRLVERNFALRVPDCVEQATRAQLA